MHDCLLGLHFYLCGKIPGQIIAITTQKEGKATSKYVAECLILKNSPTYLPLSKRIGKLYIFDILLSYFISQEGKFSSYLVVGEILTHFHLLIICTYFNLCTHSAASDSFM